jgi:hypothetical protein
MLTDVTRWNNDLTMRLILAACEASPTRIGRGIYDHCGFNLRNSINKSGVVDYMEQADHDEFPEFGVVDSVAQFLELFGDAIDAAPEHYAVGFTEVRRAAQPSEGGWRWHKWGQYYGVHSPQCEYLHDEPDIESVYTFSVVQLRS